MKVMKTFLLLVLLFLPAGVDAQLGDTLISLRFFDSTTHDELKVKNSESRLYDSSSAKIEIEAVISSFLQKGYLAASLDSLVYTPGVLNAFLYLGSTFSWGDLRFEGIPEGMPGKRRIHKAFEPGTILKPQLVEGFANEILKWYETKGHPFARLRLHHARFMGNRVDAILQVDPGNLVLIDSIIIRGDLRLNRKFLYRQIGIYPGDVYNEKKISQLDKSLASLPFLGFSREPGLEFRREGADLYLFLEPSRANRFSGILGFMSDHRQSGKMILTGDIHLSLRNSFAWGEEIDFFWKKTDLRNQELNVSFAMSHIQGSFMGLETRLNLFRFDSLYLNLDFLMAGRFALNEVSRLTAFYAIKSSQVIGEVTPVFPGQTKSRSYGLEYRFSSLDRAENPLRGTLLLPSLAFGRREFQGESSQTERSNRVEATLEAEMFFPVFRNSVIALIGKGGFLSLFDRERQVSLLETELYRLGGIHTIRGFDENSILANQYALLTMEYRWLFDEESNIFLFADILQYKKMTISETFSDMPVGFGLGTRLATRAGMFTLSYGLGVQRDNPISLKSAKIHMGYSSRF
jgi:outer membrane protein assembly factor BamA